MSWKIVIPLLLLAPVVTVAALVRLAHSDPARWHRMPGRVADKDFASGVIRVVPAGPDGLARLDAVARAWPRTRVLAGSVGEGMITYVTRSAFWGFPDYTTIRLDGAAETGTRLEIYARSRFGRRDFGVNAGRVAAWLAQL